MITAKQHIPGFAFDPRDPPPPVAEVETVAALLEVPWVKRWSERPGFVRYSVSRSIPTRPLLMVEFGGVPAWWVVAYLNADPSLAELPEWKTPAG